MNKNTNLDTGKTGTSRLRMKAPLKLLWASLFLLPAGGAFAETVLLINDNDPGRIIRLDTATDTLSATGLQLQSGGFGTPLGDCAVTSDGSRAYAVIASGSAKGVVPINLAGASVGPAIPVIDAPDDLDLSKDGRYLLVSKFDAIGQPGALSVIDTGSNAVIGNFTPANGDAQSVDICDDGQQVVIGDQANQKIGLLNLSPTGVLSDIANQSVPTGGLALHNAYCAPGSHSAVAASGGGSLRSFLLPSLTPVSITGFQAQSAAFAPDGSRIYIRSFTNVVRAVAYDPLTGVIGASLWQTTVTGGTGVYGRDEMIVSPDGSKVYLPQTGVLRVLDAATGADLSTQTQAELTNGHAICLQAAAPSTPDAVPDAYAFIDISNAKPGKKLASNAIVVSGINVPTPIKTKQGDYSLNGSAFTGQPGMVVNGDVVVVRRKSATTALTTVSVLVDIGGVKDSFDITTR